MFQSLLMLLSSSSAIRSNERSNNIGNSSPNTNAASAIHGHQLQPAAHASQPQNRANSSPMPAFSNQFTLVFVSIANPTSVN